MFSIDKLNVLAQTAEISEEGAAAVGAFLLVFVVIALVAFALWVWSLIHCIKNKFLSDSNRTISIVLIIVLGLLGSIIYLFMPRESKAQR